MTIVPEFLRITKDIEPIITGMLVLIIVLFFPGGILGSITKLPHVGRASLSKRLNEIENWLSNMRSRR
jgi:hypothetical protein